MNDKIMEKVLELNKCNGIYKVKCNNTSAYKDVCGVWVMFDDNNRLLEVAQTSNIFEELNSDLSYLLKDYSEVQDRAKRYTARRLFEFSKKFDVLKCDKNRTTAKYRDIAENTNSIFVFFIKDQKANSKEKAVREKIELAIAIDNNALYWNAYGNQRKLARGYYEQKRKLHNEKFAI